MDEMQISTELLRTEEMDGRTVYIYESPWSVDELTTFMDQAAPEDLKVQAEYEGEYREFIVLTQAEEDLWLILA